MLSPPSPMWLVLRSGKIDFCREHICKDQLILTVCLHHNQTIYALRICHQITLHTTQTLAQTNMWLSICDWLRVAPRDDATWFHIIFCFAVSHSLCLTKRPPPYNFTVRFVPSFVPSRPANLVIPVHTVGTEGVALPALKSLASQNEDAPEVCRLSHQRVSTIS